MPSTSLAYRAAMRAGRLLLPLAATLHPKLARGHRARAGVLQRFRAWARDHREPGRPLVWLHAPSVGEGLQAESVLARLRARHPEWQFVYTHFSPSAERLAQRLPVDYADYLPYDLRGAMDTLLRVLRPDALVFTKLDLWPELATRAAAAGVPVVLVAATVSAGSGRLRWPTRALLAPGYACVRRAGAIARADGERLQRLGVAREAVQVTGDPRCDSVLERIREVSPEDPLLRFGRGAPTLVAGSTWPEDEEVLLDAFARLYVHRPEARLILVPHEPDEDHLAAVERRARRNGLPRPVRLSAATEPTALLLVDRVGILAALYGAGTMAYVGGGFGRSGLHSVLEPAAWRIPVVFGPRWQQSRDASLLLEAGGAEALLELGTTEASESLHRLWDDWIRDERRRSAQGRHARSVVEAGLGASDASADLIEAVLEESRGESAGAGAGAATATG